jgi:hypothetical protein
MSGSQQNGQRSTGSLKGTFSGSFITPARTDNRGRVKKNIASLRIQSSWRLRQQEKPSSVSPLFLSFNLVFHRPLGLQTQRSIFRSFEPYWPAYAVPLRLIQPVFGETPETSKVGTQFALLVLRLLFNRTHAAALR